MQEHIKNKVYHIEILPPKQETEKLAVDLELFAEKYNRIMASGFCTGITDNAMGLLAFQGTEVIEELGLEVYPEQVMIHLNTFHTKEDLHNILEFCKAKKIKYLLVISGDGSERLPKLQPQDIGAKSSESVTAVELLKYINDEYPNTFVLGVAFNPYEPPEHEFEKMERKIAAGATFIITQPIIEKNAIVDELIAKYPQMPIIFEAWMSKKLHLLSDAVGYEIPEDTEFDPIATLKMLHSLYPNCGAYLSLLGFKNQYPLIKDTWA
ncbi:MAG: methylenetetrahydrofolate reductase [Clostridia bacterium]